MSGSTTPTADERFRAGMAASRGEAPPAGLYDEPERSIEAVERERIANDRERADYLDRLAVERQTDHRHAEHLRCQADALRDHARDRERRRAFRKALPAGQVPAVLLGPDCVGPCARGQLSAGRPQGQARRATACARGPDEPHQPRPGDEARRRPDDDVAGGGRSR